MGSTACAAWIWTRASSQFFAVMAFCAATRGFCTAGLSFCLAAGFSFSAATATETGSSEPPATPTSPAAARAAINTRFAFFIIGLSGLWVLVARIVAPAGRTGSV